MPPSSRKKSKGKARVAFAGKDTNSTGTKNITLGRPGNMIRRSVSLDPDVDAMAHKLAGSNDFSSFVNEALRRDIQRTQMLGLLRDLDEHFGPVSKTATMRAEELWQARSRSTAER